MPLYDLPPEILFQILQIVRDAEFFETRRNLLTRSVRNRSILNASLVSRFLHDLSQRILFERLSWYIASPIGPDQVRAHTTKLQDNALRCVELLRERPHLQTHVRSLKIDSASIGRGVYRGRTPIIDAVEKILPTLSHLRDLSLVGVHISLPVYQAIQTLPFLHSLSLVSCPFPSDDAAEMAAMTAPTNLKSIIIENHNFGIDEAERPLYANLIFTPSLRHLSMDHGITDVVCEYMETRPELNALSSLSVAISRDNDQEARLMRVLVRCPALEDIAVSLRRKDTTEPVAVPGSALRNLRTYRGSFGCAEEFIRGRPVRHIDIDSAVTRRAPSQLNLDLPEIHKGLERLTGGTVPVRHLAFKVTLWENSLLDTVAVLFPELESLSIGGRGPHLGDWEYDNGALAVSKMAKLKNIGVVVERSGGAQLADQLAVVRAWGNVCPLLQEVTLSKDEVWSRSGPDKWELINTAPLRLGTEGRAIEGTLLQPTINK